MQGLKLRQTCRIHLSASSLWKRIKPEREIPYEHPHILMSNPLSPCSKYIIRFLYANPYLSDLAFSGTLQLLSEGMMEIGSWAGWVRVFVLLDDMYLYKLRQSLGPCMNASFLIPTFQSGTLEGQPQRDRNVKVLVEVERSRRQGRQAAASVVVTESML